MPIDLEPIVRQHVQTFNAKRRAKIGQLRVSELLRKKNPYLFIARNTVTADDLARSLVTATLSSSEETQFGQTLENIAIDVCAQAFGGQKSSATGIDLEFYRDNRRYIVSIKSGPSWGNSSQVAKLREDFRRASRVIRQNDLGAVVEAINGCCYGRAQNDYGDYRKVCGAAFWELISGEDDLYRRLLSLLDQASANGFAETVEAAISEIADQLRVDWADEHGQLDWERILDHNSGSLES